MNNKLPHPASKKKTAPQKKRRKLKKSVKKVLLLFSLILFALITTRLYVVQKHHIELEKKATQLVALKKRTKEKQERQEKQEKQEKLEPYKTYSSKTKEKLSADHLNSHLILQTDERWANSHYGWGAVPTIAKNGCAIASLSMVNAYFNKSTDTPNKVLKWAGDNYFTDGGTSWNIFPDFAVQYNYNFINLGDNIDSAIPYLEQGIPVVASMHAGDYTTVGHILVLASTNSKGIRMLDPNDNVQKKNSLTTHSTEKIQSNLNHLWVFTKLT